MGPILLDAVALDCFCYDFASIFITVKNWLD